MRPTHLFAQDKYVSGSAFAIYGCAWPEGPMWAPAKGSLPEISASSEVFLTLSAPAFSAPPTITDPVIATVNNVIESPGDQDAFAFNAVAGETYIVSLRGVGANPLQDTYLGLFDNTFALVNEDDDGGDGVNSLITFTAAYTGQYFFLRPGLSGFRPDRRPIRSRSWPMTGSTSRIPSAAPIGDRTRATSITASSIPRRPGPMARGSARSTASRSPSRPARSISIEVAGGADYASDFTALPPGEIDSVIVVYGPDQSTVITLNDDISFPNDIGSRVSFVAEESGTYYLRRLLLPALDRRLFGRHSGARPGRLQPARRDQLVQRRQYRRSARRHREGLLRRRRREFRRDRRQWHRSDGILRLERLREAADARRAQRIYQGHRPPVCGDDQRPPQPSSG